MTHLQTCARAIKGEKGVGKKKGGKREGGRFRSIPKTWSAHYNLILCYNGRGDEDKRGKGKGKAITCLTPTHPEYNN